MRLCWRWLVIGTLVFAPAPAAGADSETTPLVSVPPAIGEIATSRAAQLKAVGYVEQEFFVEGVARSYAKRGEWTSHGVWDVAPGDTAPYKIRILVRYPEQANRFNGIVFVEWFNVSGQSEAEPDFTSLQDELLRGGYAYVGIGAQAAGIHGASGIKSKFNAARYASLSHPGDSYSYDIYSQAGRVIRSSRGVAPLGPLAGRIRFLLADGESQSAGRMVTYVNAVHPVAQVYDGFFIHSRSGGGAPLAQDKDNKPTTAVPTPARIRADLKVPVLVVQAETDVVNFVAARQPDTARLRTWELAGTSHGDAYGLTNGKTRPLTLTCEDKDPKLSVPINDGPMTYTMRAGLRHMKRWLAGGTPPPSGQPLQMDGKTIRRDPSTGLALGGVRTPQVDVPVRTLAGIREPAGGGGFCRQFGRTDEWNGDADPWDGEAADPSPTPEPVLARLYPTKDAYVSRFQRAIDAGVKAGFLLKEDAPALRNEAVKVQFDTRTSRSGAGGQGAGQDAGPVVSTPPALGEVATNRAAQLKAAGYVEQEFFVEGVARSYQRRGEWTSDGMWDVAPGDSAPYKIRILARYPAQANRFNGVVFVEWMNVTGQSEADPNFTVLQDELLRDGYAYVGVGAQSAGINGASGLKKVNPARYASISHPGDSYSYDIYSQAGRVLRSAKGIAPLGPLTSRIRYLLADGESQSANRMVTYVNAVHPVAHVYDGFFIHSRVGSGGAPLVQEIGKPTPIGAGPAARIRTDLKVPVLVVQMEGDVPNFVAARQPDTPRYRTWEVAGTSHADRYLLTGGGVRPQSTNCDEKDPKVNVPVNDGPMTYPMRAGLRHMKRWLAGGPPPPSAPPLVTDGSTIRRDPATGNALGGLRTPQVDVPTRTLHGLRAPAGGGAFCFLFGRTDEWNGDADPWDGSPADPSPTPEPVLSRLYPTKDAYVSKFQQAIDAGVRAGFLLKEDVAAIRSEAARVQLDTRTAPGAARSQSSNAGEARRSAAARTGRLLLTRINVRDLPASLRFFAEGLGLTEQSRFSPGKGTIEVSLGEPGHPLPSPIMLIHRESRTTAYAPGEWGTIVLEVKDVHAIAARVERAGGKLVRRPADSPAAAVIVGVVADPDGHEIELVQFK